MSAVGEKAGARTLEDRAKHFGVALVPGAREALLTYGALLLSWSARINLTAAKSLDALIEEHFSDSFAIAARLERHRGAPLNTIDVGSGGGLPAIAVALLRPRDHVTLVEATGKKVAFLRTAVRELSLGDRLQVEHRRVEMSDEPGAFDVATSRAMLPPPQWLALGRRLVRVGGTVFCLGTGAIESPADGLTLVDQTPYRRDRWVAELQRST